MYSERKEMATRKNETRKREKRFNGKQMPFTATISIRLFVALCLSRSSYRHCSEEMLLRNLFDELHNIFKSHRFASSHFFLFGVNGCLLYTHTCVMLQSIGNMEISPALANVTHITCRWRAKRVVVGLCSAAFLFCGMFHPFLRRN